jgi:hypothetical protein
VRVEVLPSRSSAGHRDVFGGRGSRVLGDGRRRSLSSAVTTASAASCFKLGERQRHLRGIDQAATEPLELELGQLVGPAILVTLLGHRRERAASSSMGTGAEVGAAPCIGVFYCAHDRAVDPQSTRGAAVFSSLVGLWAAGSAWRAACYAYAWAGLLEGQHGCASSPGRGRRSWYPPACRRPGNGDPLPCRRGSSRWQVLCRSTSSSKTPR